MFMLAIDLRRTCTLEDSGLFPELAQGGRGWEEKDRSSPNARDLRSECPKLRSRTGNRTFPFRPAASVSRPFQPLSRWSLFVQNGRSMGRRAPRSGLGWRTEARTVPKHDMTVAV